MLGSHRLVDHITRGRTGEEAAVAFLRERGYEIVACNQRTPVGELDIVCRFECAVVIVEVKARGSDHFGDGLEAIGPRKARRLRAAALWWLCTEALYPCEVHFDAVIVSIDGGGTPRRLRHVKDVIGQDGRR